MNQFTDLFEARAPYRRFVLLRTRVGKWPWMVRTGRWTEGCVRTMMLGLHLAKTWAAVGTLCDMDPNPADERLAQFAAHERFGMAEHF